MIADLRLEVLNEPLHTTMIAAQDGVRARCFMSCNHLPTP